MKLVTFKNKLEQERIGIVEENGIYEWPVPITMIDFIENYESIKPLLPTYTQLTKYDYKTTKICSPLPIPRSLRDFYAFEQHVKTARENRGLKMIKEWYEIPVFYFSNHSAIIGPLDEVAVPKGSNCLDYELEIACVIGKKGKNIPISGAMDYIFGFTIMNDWSARDLQVKEMKVGLGPAKGKDFATSLGPYLVTKDELAPFYDENGHYHLQMKAYVNNKLLSTGNVSSLYYTFAQMIAQASTNTTLYPGEIIGSGTVGSGCILELGLDTHRWLLPGDEIKLEIDGLGSLINTIC
ncbi:MAG: fumarylacetoacetate hydrolase family protein [Bacillaceae bacterium]